MSDGLQIAINLPEEHRAGVYSDVVMVWHSEWGFTLDFLAQVQPVDENAETAPFQVVSRVRIPPAVIFPLVKTLHENLSNYEKKFGPIPEPGNHGGGET